MQSLETIRFPQIKKAHPINAGKPPAPERELAPRGEYSFRLIFGSVLKYDT
jgi:hypothetical protein